MKALPVVGQLDYGLRLSPQGVRGDKALRSNACPRVNM
jgi:hypothetical protein